MNGRPLKAIDSYFRKIIADYQSKLNKSRAKTSRKLKKLHAKAINFKPDTTSTRQ